MEGDRGLTEQLQQFIIPDLEYYNRVGSIGTIEQYELAWSEAGCFLESLFEDKVNLGLLVNYLSAEFHARHDIDPQIQKLRELLESATIIADKVRLDGSLSADLRSNFINLGQKCSDWIGWINSYFPPKQSKQGNKPKRISAAAKKLATPELQAVKQKLVDAGLIKDGKWTGISAEFGFLVNELSYTHYVINGERKAWIECADWAGFDGNIQSARKGIEQHPDMDTPITDIIRDACKK